MQLASFKLQLNNVCPHPLAASWVQTKHELIGHLPSNSHFNTPTTFTDDSCLGEFVPSYAGQDCTTILE